MAADPYDTLGISKSATAEQIKSAYRRLARSSHPDLHPDDAEAASRFSAISAAYDLLKDPAIRARFDAGEIDASGTERPQRQYYRDFARSAANPYQRRPVPGFGSEQDPADLFAQFLRGGMAQGFADRGFSARGEDLHFRLELGFLEAARGTEKHITLPGRGAIALNIPPGSADGKTLRLRGRGNQGSGGGPDGDALVTLLVRPHPVFQREGDDILISLPVTIDEAILGAAVKVPTIDGPVEMRIPRGSSSGRVLRLRGRGLARGPGGEGRGDQLAELRIMAPAGDDPALEEFLRGWQKAQSHDPRAALLREALS